MVVPTLITYSNFGYIDFAKNLILNLANVLKHHKLHFYCLDKQTYDALIEYKYDFLTVELFEQNVSSNFEVYETPEYNKLTHTKTNVLRSALARYPFIHFIDCDVVCLKEPSADYYKQYEQFDVVFQFDLRYNNTNSLSSIFKTTQCTGNTSMRRTHGTMKLIQLLEQHQTKNLNDQDCLHKIFIMHRAFDIRSFLYTKLFVYPPAEYTNGSWKGSLDRTYFFHANHVIGKDEKIALLKNVKQWFL